MTDSAKIDAPVAGVSRRGRRRWNHGPAEDLTSFTRRFSALVALAHPLPSLGTALAAVAAALPLLLGMAQWHRLVLLFVSVLLQQAAISVHNDWCDRDVDLVAKSGRAIPAGYVQGRTALLLASGTAAAAILLATALGWDMVTLVVLGLASGVLYNARLKRTPFSWVPFALAFPLIPLFGMAALDRWTAWWWTMFLVPLPSIVSIHLTDALPDYDQDAAMGVNGLAQFLGKDLAAKAASASAGIGAIAVVILGTLLPSLSSQATWVAQAGFGCAVMLIALGEMCPGWRRVAMTAGAAIAALAWAAATAIG
ncbi:MAG TPA: UbiA family prenyltransferase [Chloroflexota bacterium]|nr:UbiA family prenyltransferase [Chloroflexota bacterium]